MLKSFLAATAALSLVAGGAIAADDHKMKGKGKTIVETAVATDSLSTLVAAVQAAELVDTLNSDGPFTVFAPTNAGFAAIQSTVDTLLEPENKEMLQGVLTYHVVAGKVKAGDLVKMADKKGSPFTVETVSGGELTVNVSDAGVTITDANGGVANVVKADVKAENGVVHVIDAVLVPAM